ncbi:MAG: hypothetical protein NVS4B12_20070 [Ktedonobacteraceae bacterium]
MTAFLVTAAIIGGLIVVGLLINVYLYTQGVFRRRRARLRQQQEPMAEKRVTTAGLEEQFYTSLGIGPNKPVDNE